MNDLIERVKAESDRLEYWNRFKSDKTKTINRVSLLLDEVAEALSRQQWVSVDDRQLTFAQFQKINAERSIEWMKKSPTQDSVAQLLFHSNELGDECGEVQGAVKKLVRGLWGIPGAIDEESAKTMIAKEIGDVITVCFLLASKLDIDVATATASKFNEVSDKHGFRQRLPDPPKGEE